MDRPVESTVEALRVRPVVTAWLLAVGVDLLFNAGIFSPLFHQDREPGLLSDQALFRRIPIAYLALLCAVGGLAWLTDRVDVTGFRRGAVVGFGVGVLLAIMGVVYLWTAIDMTGVFVAAGAIVVIIEMTVTGGVLAAFRVDPQPSGLARRVLLAALASAVAGIVVQNLVN